MELLFAGLAGLAIGAVIGLLARPRTLIGAAMPAALGGISALALWEAFTWLGAVPGFAWLAYNAGWIWWLTLLLAAAIVAAIVIPMASRRERADADLLDRLSHVGRTKPRRRRKAGETAAQAAAAQQAEDEADAKAEAGADAAADGADAERAADEAAAAAETEALADAEVDADADAEIDTAGEPVAHGAHTPDSVLADAQGVVEDDDSETVAR